MREVIVDTETTGFSPSNGHKIVSVAAIELVNCQPTGRFLHHYINPGRESDAGALAVHGLTTEFLADKPRFADVADELRAFLAGDSIVAHNAPFDINFLQAEFNVLGQRPVSLPYSCTLAMARATRGWKAANKLDNLVADFGIANLREITGCHGALVDALLLVPVYQHLRSRVATVWTRDWLIHFGVIDEGDGNQAGQSPAESTQPVVAAAEGGEGSAGSREVAGRDHQVSDSVENGSADGRHTAEGTADGVGEQPAAIIEFVVVDDIDTVMTR